MRLARVVVLVVVLVCTGIAGGVLRMRQQAAVLLEDVKHLDTNADPSSAFRAFREKHRHQLTREECRNDLCESEFLVNNWVLSNIHLAPRTELRARFTLFRQKPSTVDVEYTSEIFRQDSPIVHVQEDFCAERTDIRCDHFALNPHGRNVRPAWNGIIEFGQLATDEQKQAAWGLNLSCLAVPHGCKDISLLSPKLWRATGIGTVSSCMQSSADSASEASQRLSDSCFVQ
jgi:hypothetical protein